VTPYNPVVKALKCKDIVFEVLKKIIYEYTVRKKQFYTMSVIEDKYNRILESLLKNMNEHLRWFINQKSIKILRNSVTLG
jgi:hypothetical protein